MINLSHALAAEFRMLARGKPDINELIETNLAKLLVIGQSTLPALIELVVWPALFWLTASAAPSKAFWTLAPASWPMSQAYWACSDQRKIFGWSLFLAFHLPDIPQPLANHCGGEGVVGWGRERGGLRAILRNIGEAGLGWVLGWLGRAWDGSWVNLEWILGGSWCDLGGSLWISCAEPSVHNLEKIDVELTDYVNAHWCGKNMF